MKGEGGILGGCLLLGGSGCDNDPPLRWGGLELCEAAAVTRGMGEICEGSEPSGCGNAPPSPSGNPEPYELRRFSRLLPSIAVARSLGFERFRL